MVARSQLRKLPERITLPGVCKRKGKGGGRGSPMEIDSEDDGVHRDVHSPLDLCPTASLLD